ncbi:alpha-L-fucosidase [Carboxylicivirga sp. M1479]|uniref:alpha-L-fucosidase n=1 Tax=Carboxylicivirga sp. M1479 TaxID=2594476 RepID=UPI0011779E7B|nr:alpha-L-fucosidase [Carboxylicivirga sp. M1479]TRX70395.1 crotonobetainyl-CoA--carnitine CoA-transferase [Carboxylicivirga sp. M1479]
MRVFSSLVLGLFFIYQSANSQIIQPSNRPNKTQKLLIERGYGMFIHFGVNTFANKEWSDGTLPATIYNPVNLDCDQWVRVARDAGFRYVLLVTKHHDGFCLWDSKYTEYDVASSPVKTDVVAEVAKACQKYDLELGIYYSLWDRNHPAYTDKNPNVYVDYMINQLTELLMNYGAICELWFDGGWDREVADWDLDRVYKFVKGIQPHCAVGVNHTIELEPCSREFALPDSMIVDNKYTFQYFPGDFRLWDPKIAHKLDEKQYIHKGESYYLPFENTICLSKRWNWFQKDDFRPVRELDELEELFYWCTDNGNTLVMNVPPDNTGRIREHEVNAIIALGLRLNIEKGKPLPRNGKFISLKATVSASSIINDDEVMFGAQLAVDGGMQTRWAASDTLSILEINLDPKKPFNKISIFEFQDSKDGGDGFSNYRINRIQSYSIEIFKNKEWQTIYMDDKSMGDCKVIRFPYSYQTSKLRFRVLKATAPPSIYEINVIQSDTKGYF